MGDVIQDWKLRIADAYDSWKADFDAYTTVKRTQILRSNSAKRQRPLDDKEFATYTTTTCALYHAAHVILFSDFLDLQIYAGARQLLGRPVGRTDYVRSQRVVKRWTNEQAPTSCKAAWHAAMIIRDAATALEDFDAGNVFIHPWCLYLATITVWSFHHARPSVAASQQHQGSYSEHEEDDEIIWDARADMEALIGGMTSNSAADKMMALPVARKETITAGLTAIISKRLSKVRWAIVHEGMLVLRGLVPGRLINQAEGFC